MAHPSRSGSAESRSTTRSSRSDGCSARRAPCPGPRRRDSGPSARACRPGSRGGLPEADRWRRGRNTSGLIRRRGRWTRCPRRRRAACRRPRREAPRKGPTLFRLADASRHPLPRGVPDRAILPGPVALAADVQHPGVREDSEVVVHGFFCLVIDPEEGADLLHRVAPFAIAWGLC